MHNSFHWTPQHSSGHNWLARKLNGQGHSGSPGKIVHHEPAYDEIVPFIPDTATCLIGMTGGPKTGEVFIMREGNTVLFYNIPVGEPYAITARIMKGASPRCSCLAASDGNVSFHQPLSPPTE